MFELKENQVMIFKNDKKNGETQPDYKGQINVKGETLDIALWVKEGKKGKFFSGKISEPYQKAELPQSDVYQSDGKFDSPPPPINEQEDGSELPF